MFLKLTREVLGIFKPKLLRGLCDGSSTDKQLLGTLHQETPEYNPVLPQLEALTNEMTAIGKKYGAHSPEVIRMLLSITTPDHLLYGSDYPYVAPQVLTQSLGRMKQYLTTEADLAPYRELILWKNAQQLFQIKP